MKIVRVASVIIACALALSACGKSEKEVASSASTEEVAVDSESLSESEIASEGEFGSSDEVSSASENESPESEVTSSPEAEQESAQNEAAWKDENALFGTARIWSDTGLNQLGNEYSYSNFDAMSDSKWALVEKDPNSTVQKHDIYTHSIENPETEALENSYDLTNSWYRDAISTERYVPAADTDLKCVYTYTGHKIYVSNDGVEGRYIFSSCDVWPILLSTNDAIPVESEALLFEESSPLRIYVFKNQSALDEAEKQWDEGQAILNGQSEELDGRIIMNGRLLPEDVSIIKKDDDIYVSYAKLAQAYNTSASITTVTKQLMYQDYFQGNMVIPSKSLLNFKDDISLSALYGFEINKGDATCEYSSYKFKIPSTSAFEMSVTDIANISGWDFYYDGTMLNIVTSKYEATNNFILKPAQS